MVLAAVSVSSMAVSQTAARRTVLAIYWSPEDFPQNPILHRTIREELDRSPVPIDLYSEYLESDSLPEDVARESLREYIRLKYHGRTIDVVIANTSVVLEFVVRYRQELFPDAPIVYIGIEAETLKLRDAGAGMTGTISSASFGETLDLALTLHPDTERVFVVANSPSTTLLQVLQRELRPFANRVDITYISDGSQSAMLAAVKAVPFLHSLVLFIRHAQEPEHSARMLEPARLVADAAPVPVYGVTESFIGTGIVGGRMYTIVDQASRAGRMTLRILAGERAQDIPIGRATLVPIFDWRQLQRWGISESRLPPGSEVLFREPSAWQKYRWEISAVAAVMLLQAGLITWLIYEHRRRHAAELATREAMSELTQMNRVSGAGELSASIAHEVNQPLAAIALNASAALNWLKAKTPDLEEARDALVRVVSESHRAGDIVTNLRALFRKDAQQPGTVEINKVILSVLALVRIELEKHDIEVHTQLDHGLPAMAGNEVQLQQVVLNLVMNAKDAMQSTPSQRELRVQSQRSADGRVQVSIEDSGSGISPSDVKRIFQPMFTTKAHGMGMGLSICRSIVEAHHGTIWAEARTGVGSAFRFSLPANG
jgi:signal transduction histidine kinase